MVSIAKSLALLIVIIAACSFIVGSIAGASYKGSIQIADFQKPLGLIGLGSEKNSPQDRIKDYNIRAYDDRIIVFINNPYLAKFADTHSMEPLLDKKSTGIEIVPKSSAEIKIGDVISYKSMYDGDIVIHRVAKIGNDPEGWYAVARGDNNQADDSEKIRFSEVKRILVGVLY